MQRMRRRPPISSHPAFPVIVALWFAALLGIGSLIVPVVLFEKLASLTGLAAIVPAAQPPLGATARILITLGAAGLGLIFGLVLARQVAAAQARQTTKPIHGGKVPISALEELGAESLDQPVEGAFNDPVPVTAQASSVATLPSFADDPAPTEYPAAHMELTAGDIRELAEVDTAVEYPAARPAPKAADRSAEQLIARPLDELGMVQLVERFALSLKRMPAAGQGSRPFLHTNSDLASAGDDSFPAEAPPRRFERPKGVVAGSSHDHTTMGAASTERALREALAKLEKMSGVG